MGCITSDMYFCTKCGHEVPRSAVITSITKANTHACIQPSSNLTRWNPPQVIPYPQIQTQIQQQPPLPFQLPSTQLQYQTQSQPITQQQSTITNPFLPFLKPKFPPPPRPLQQQLYRGEAKIFPNQYIDIKSPTNPQRTIFNWSKQNAVYYPVNIKTFTSQVIRWRTFQQKMLWFRLNMQGMRIPWQKGCETLKVDRANLVKSSKEGLKNADLHKQLKIMFDDEVVHDAGGLLRQWMHMFIKQIFSSQTGIFKQCMTDETAYKFIWDNKLNEQYALENVGILGIIIGKALFERVSLNCFLNRTILRQVCQQTVLMHDTYSFDKQFYNSWKSILDNDGADALYLNFSEQKTNQNGQTQNIDLVKNGKNINVTDSNKYQYIYQIIQLYCNRSVHKYIKALLAGIYKVIPPQFLSVFEPHQIQMLLNGPQFIDVKDWKQNTQYKGYKHNDQVIVWFWSIVQKFDQKKLGNLLHYCTGSKSVPILGFKYLESNRNTINKFTIQKIQYTSSNPYPKSYTCFNRLSLPEYSSMNQLQKNLNIVINQEINHFGLD